MFPVPGRDPNHVGILSLFLIIADVERLDSGHVGVPAASPRRPTEAHGGPRHWVLSAFCCAASLCKSGKDASSTRQSQTRTRCGCRAGAMTPRSRAPVCRAECMFTQAQGSTECSVNSELGGFIFRLCGLFLKGTEERFCHGLSSLPRSCNICIRQSLAPDGMMSSRYDGAR